VPRLVIEFAAEKPLLLLADVKHLLMNVDGSTDRTLPLLRV
jgi:hypothetical protein